MIDEFDAKTAVVTGAAGGIGLALTERFVSEGMRVVMADIEEIALSREATRLEAAGANVTGVLTDVRDPASVDALRDQALSLYGAVHVVCNNAGVALAGPMVEATAADWRWIVDVNILGVAHGVSTFGPLLVEQGEGHIVNTASEAGLVTNDFIGAYCATKHAVVGLSESLWREVHPQGVGVSCLCPNLINTRIFESERNRDDGAIVRPNEAAMLAPMREAMQSTGLPPSAAAHAVIAAILADRFWVFTHEFTPGLAAARSADIEAERNPTDPYAELLAGLESPSDSE